MGKQSPLSLQKQSCSIKRFLRSVKGICFFSLGKSGNATAHQQESGIYRKTHTRCLELDLASIILTVATAQAAVNTLQSLPAFFPKRWQATQQGNFINLISPT